MIGRPGPLSVSPTDRSSFTATIEPVGLGGGALQVAHVADVQQVEAAVGERDRPPGRAIARDGVDELGLPQTDDPSAGSGRQFDVAVPSSSLRRPFLRPVLERRVVIARRRRRPAPARDTVAVPRFITTRPPA